MNLMRIGLVEAPTLLFPIAGFGGDDVADAAARVGDVIGVTRNHVEVELGDGLAGGGAVVDAEIEGVWWGPQCGG